MSAVARQNDNICSLSPTARLVHAMYQCVESAWHPTAPARVSRCFRAVMVSILACCNRKLRLNRSFVVDGWFHGRLFAAVWCVAILWLEIELSVSFFIKNQSLVCRGLQAFRREVPMVSCVKTRIQQLLASLAFPQA